MKKLLILISSVALLAGCQSQPAPPVTSDMDQVPPMTTTTDETDSVETQGQNNPVIGGYSDEDAEWETVESAILAESPNATISSFYMPEIMGKIYASAVTNIEFDQFSETELSTLTVYEYNLVSQNLSKIYEQDQEEYISLAGSDGVNLLFKGVVSVDYSPGLCAQIWNSTTASYYKLNLEDPSKLEDYQVGQTLIERANKMQADCKASAR